MVTLKTLTMTKRVSVRAIAQKEWRVNKDLDDVWLSQQVKCVCLIQIVQLCLVVRTVSVSVTIKASAW